ncbi:MAG TPA: LytTR family DNA-binding domain-containing protein [Bacteroidia bacterium]|nr:LytTR family DNA-binding domain-containing protein [Bacteroidia bacterium]
MKGFIEIADNRKVIVIPISDISRLESQDGYTIIHTKSRQQHVSTKHLKEIEKKLDPKIFHRVHKSHVINMQEVRTYEKGNGGYVTMSDGSIVAVSRRKKADFLRELIS